MFARNFKYPRTTEPELDANSLASLGIESTLLSSSEMPRRFPLSLSRPQIIKTARQHQPNQGAPPNQIARIEPPDIQRVKRDERRDRQYAEAQRHSINDGHVTFRVASRKKQHHAQRQHNPAHLFHRC